MWISGTVARWISGTVDGKGKSIKKFALASSRIHLALVFNHFTNFSMPVVQLGQ